MKLSNHQQNRRRGERGSILAVSAFGMLSFLLATGLCVDISHFYLVKTELQNAADASALAGASALNSDDGGIQRAVDVAIQAMNKYEFNKGAVTLSRSDVLFSRNLNGTYVNESSAKADAANIRFVKVSIPAVPVTTTFAAPVLGSKRDITAEATAGMSVPLNSPCDYIPVMGLDSRQGEPANYFVPGQTYTVRRAPGTAASPGNYQILAIDDPGASDDRWGLGRGVRNCAPAGSLVKTKPGVSSGAVRQGINTRFGDYASGLDPSMFPPDENVQENITYQQYLDAQQALDDSRSPAPGTYQQPPRGLTPARNRRVVLIPIVRVSELDNGRDMVTIDRFAAFFLQTRVDGGNGGDIKVEYIGKRLVTGRGSYVPGAGPGSPELTIPVLYK